MFNAVEQLSMIPETVFKCCFICAKVTFLLISTDVLMSCWLDKLGLMINGHAAVANFYIDPVKKPIEFVMRRKMLI